MPYGPQVEAILAAHGNGARPMPLEMEPNCPEAARTAIGGRTASELFPDAFAPDTALAGLWLYLSCFDESHSIAQDVNTVEGSYWHAILHRQEPDPGNAGYWFRRVGQHAIFPQLLEAAVAKAGASSGLKLGSRWDPFAFIDFCEKARLKPGSAQESLAKEIQLVEWQLLFHHCARPSHETG